MPDKHFGIVEFTHSSGLSITFTVFWIPQQHCQDSAEDTHWHLHYTILSIFSFFTMWGCKFARTQHMWNTWLTAGMRDTGMQFLRITKILTLCMARSTWTLTFEMRYESSISSSVNGMFLLEKGGMTRTASFWVTLARIPGNPLSAKMTSGPGNQTEQ